MDYLDILRKGLDQLQLNYDENMINEFDIYKEVLQEWNDKTNITRIIENEEVMEKHFLDSLTCYSDDYFKDGDKIIDVGTGGGFPGIPLKIYNKTFSVSLLDARNKKVKFLQAVSDTLDLDIECLHGRAEDFGDDPNYREQYDVAVARAVASLDSLSEYCLPFVKVGGYFIALKGSDNEEEINNAKTAIKKLGGKICKVQDVKIPNTDIVHSLVFIKKIKTTPSQFPRKAGKPTKNPL